MTSVPVLGEPDKRRTALLKRLFAVWLMAVIALGAVAGWIYFLSMIGLLVGAALLGYVVTRSWIRIETWLTARATKPLIITAVYPVSNVVPIRSRQTWL